MLFHCFDRPTVHDKIYICIHYGGTISFESKWSYVGGNVETFKGWDIDVISSIVVVKFVKSLGYASIKSLWYMQPSVEASGSVIRALNCDADIRNISSDVKGHREVDIFVEHNLQEQTV